MLVVLRRRAGESAIAEPPAVMQTDESPAKRIAVVGGGISGLAAALRLIEIDPGCRVSLFERDNRPGGVLRTVRQGDWLVEQSADNFLTRLPYGQAFCEKVGVEDQLLPTEESRRRALVVSRGRVTLVPEGFLLMSPKALGPVLRSPVLSWPGKLRLCCEPLVPKRREEGDESVASFARRRVGREAFERLVQPLLAGIYTADPEKLSMAATMPQFLEQEWRHGSLLKAARRQEDVARKESGARYGLFVAPRDGMQAIADAAAARLPDQTLRRGVEVTSVSPVIGGWQVTPRGQQAEFFDGVILATPAFVSAELVEGFNATLAAKLRAIEYAGASIVCFGLRVDQLPGLPSGFGFVVPSIEGRKIIAASFGSLKFPGRAPEGHVLVRVFLGGALQPELAELNDDQLTHVAMEELRSLCGVQGDPVMTMISRWPRRMPQYHVGHIQRIGGIHQSLESLPGLQVAGAAYEGVGVPQCVHSGEQAAARVLDAVNKKPPG